MLVFGRYFYKYKNENWFKKIKTKTNKLWENTRNSFFFKQMNLIRINAQ